MAIHTPGVKISLKTGESITAKRVVGLSAAKTVTMWDTSTSRVIGVSADFGDSSASVPVIVSGSAKVTCNASISAGAIVAPATGTGGKIQAVAANTVTAFPQTLGIALEAGSSDAAIEVLLCIENRTAGI